MQKKQKILGKDKTEAGAETQVREMDLVRKERRLSIKVKVFTGTKSEDSSDLQINKMIKLNIN